MKRAARDTYDTYDDLQSLSDVTEVIVEWNKKKKTCTKPHDPFMEQIELFTRLKRKCNSCNVLLPQARNTEFLCEQRKCHVIVYHLCAVCVQSDRASLVQCPVGFGCRK